MTNPLQMVYRLLLRLDQRRKSRSLYRPQYPVISVGGITTGGAGKTPLVLLVAEMLEEAGYLPVILSRGYRSRLEKDYGFICSGEDEPPDPHRYGDEPVFLVSHLERSCVVVGRRRAENLRQFIREHGSNRSRHVVILDDGFQHRQIDRDLDIVVFDGKTLTDGSLLPTGNLREPLDSLDRADVLVLRRSEGDLPDPATDIPSFVPELDVPLVTAMERTFPPRSDVDGSQLPEGEKEVVLVTGIARGERVLTSLDTHGVRVCRHLRYGDHHRYTGKDASAILRAAHSERVNAVVTTEKDVVKLRQFQDLRSILYVLPHRIVPADPDEFRRIILDRISQFTYSTR